MRCRVAVFLLIAANGISAQTGTQPATNPQIEPSKVVSPQAQSAQAPVKNGASGAATGPAAVDAGGTQSPDYSKEAVVIERMISKATFEKDGTETRELTVAARMQSQSGVQAFSVLKFPYVSSYENVEFDYVRVRKPEGTVITTRESNVLDLPAEITQQAPMYSDIHEKHVTVKALDVGDTVEYVVRFRGSKPQVPGQFWLEFTFPKDVVVRDAELEISVPRHKYVKVASPDYKPQVRNEGERRIYLWKTAVLEPNQGEQPRVASRPDVELTSFRSWNEVGRWYDGLQTPQLAVTPELRTKATELTKGLTTDDEKARALYEYVSTRFHYVPLSFGIGRFQPHAAEEVLENEYGDCKDKHTLLAALLNAVGIEAWPAAINSLRKIDPDLPSPGQFDHVITYVPRGGNPLWLDTTPGVAPYGMLLAQLRDKQALVIPKGKPAELKKTPVNPPFAHSFRFDVQGKVDPEGTLTAHVKETLRGDDEVTYRIAFRATPEGRWNELVQNLSASEGFDGEVSNVTASAPEDTSKPFEFAYDYTRKDYSDWSNRRITAPFPPMGVEAAATQERAPTEPVLLGAPGEAVFTAKIELPAHVDRMPGDLSYSEPWAGFDAKYKLEGNTFVAERRLKVKENEVPLAEWERYKKFAKAVSDDRGAWIQLGGASASASQIRTSGAESDVGRIGYTCNLVAGEACPFPRPKLQARCRRRC